MLVKFRFTKETEAHFGFSEKTFLDIRVNAHDLSTCTSERFTGAFQGVKKLRGARKFASVAPKMSPTRSNLYIRRENFGLFGARR